MGSLFNLVACTCNLHTRNITLWNPGFACITTFFFSSANGYLHVTMWQPPKPVEEDLCDSMTILIASSTNQVLSESRLWVKGRTLYHILYAIIIRWFNVVGTCILQVNPSCDYKSVEAHTMAANSSSQAKLEHIHVVDTLGEALQNCSMVLFEDFPRLWLHSALAAHCIREGVLKPTPWNLAL